MHIVVINLPSQEGRWVHVARQFALAGLKAERVEAVSGRDLSPERLVRLYSAALNRGQYHKPLCAGEVGCYASHLAAWQRLLDTPERHLAVFEDDILVAPDLAGVLDALEHSGDEWDMVKLVGRPRERVRSRLAGIGTRELVTYARVPGLTSAYVVSRRGAEKLLHRRLPFGRPIDIDLRHWWECDLRILGVVPYPVMAAPSSALTTIEGRRLPLDARTRFRKLVLQTRYLALNWQATWLGGALPTRAAEISAVTSRPAP